MDFLKPKTAFAVALILLTTEWVLLLLLALLVIIFFNSNFYQLYPEEIPQLRFLFSGFLLVCILAFSISSFVNFKIARSIFQNKDWPKFNKIILVLAITALALLVGNDIKNYTKGVFDLSVTKIFFISEIFLQMGILGWVIKKQSRRVF